MGDFQTGAPELTKAAGDMENTNQLLVDEGRQLAQAVDSVQGAWSGAAAQAFTNLMSQYSTDFQNLNTALNSIAEQVSGSATEYQRQEDEASSDISAIMQTLGDG